ncbi:TetR/AcrR family transcriptional regulator [Pseudonocardia broussonetiae]|uniref:TetR/AcrR family transcriptional regulator n=1 Tax=Pseudonocardia broussonetiae TaxID=2736640 RepID=A0A6M6JLS7_9PSEU|nr:TetR/AcrR family transcriptional regulator [Pseudonocardia broussonetiae]QJY48275.1 TetR/AcrR family transcriptional regulator [Pseudonocardia broussonetiae]
MTAARSRARRLAPEDRRRALVDATLPLVREHGLAVSTRQIAEAAGVAEGTIFRAFPDKDALLRATFAAALDPAPTLRALADVDRSVPLRARLVAAVTVLQQRFEEVFRLVDALHAANPEHCPPGSGPGPHDPRALNAAFADALAEVVGPDGGALRVPVPEFARVLRLLTLSGTHPRLCDGQPLTADEIVGTLLDGLAAAPTTTEDTSC